MLRQKTNRAQLLQIGALRRRRILAAALALGQILELRANPLGGTVASGTASFTVEGNQLHVTVSPNAFLNWQSFNIAPGETTTFHQPSPASIVWNRINDQNPSQIWGHLNANGIVVLMNQSGFYFGPGSVVNAAGFVATTATTLPQFNPGGTWQFHGPPPLASIVNYGEIKVNSGGSAFLIAEKIENHGTLMAPDGTLGLYAGKKVLMSERPDGRGLSVHVELPEGTVDNQGKLAADGGSIFLHAQTVNQNGLLQANSVREKNGVIELIADDSIHLGASSLISAKGDDSTPSNGGKVTIKSENTFLDDAGSKIVIGGGTSGGNGGSAEISAPLMPAIHSAVNGYSPGGIGGSLLIDPRDIVLGSSGSGSANGGSVDATSAPATGTLSLNVNSAFAGLSQIKLQATRNITIQSGTLWNLVNSTGISAPGSLLSLEAGNDIVIQNNAGIRAGNGWSVSLAAGRDFTTPNGFLNNVGNITLQGTGSIEARDGSVSLRAGKNVTVATGFVRTIAGGNIDVTAIAGNVNTGTKVNGFQFFAANDVASGNYLLVDSDLGGISTAAGGNVNLTAGQDIVSFLPLSLQSQPSDAGSGAFGAAPGNVTLSAGGSVTGHYVLRNGVGTINAQNAGTLNRQLALSLIAGGWNVNARDIALQEVRNPNGIFNTFGFGSSPTKHFFDYAPDAYVNLTAANSIKLPGSALPRSSGQFDQGIPAIYAPILNLKAGAGGIQIANDIRLFPSAVGDLNLVTTDGGSLSGTKAGDLVQLIISDSSARQYTSANSFGADDHAATPIHLHDLDPVTLDISGDMNSLLLVSPKHTDISVGGNLVNSRFNLQNLHASDASSLTVAGDVINRNEFTSVPVATAPDFTVFEAAYLLPADLASLPGKFIYNRETHTLTFQGRMSTAELQTLLHLTVQLFNYDGTPRLDPFGNPLTQTVAVLDSATAQTLFNNSQDIPLNPSTGYLVSGPGTLNVKAHNMDLGATLGIQSVGPAQNHALASVNAASAAINVDLSGNLDMFSTTISSIAGGNVLVSALGNINVGSSDFAGADTIPRGIFTVEKSDVTVVANGNINLNGSRIATYDGGNIHIISLNGNVNLGQRGQGVALVEKIYVDPVTHEVITFTPKIPGSGILTTTFPPSRDSRIPSSVNQVGNIDVETPHGSILGSGAGILQLALNSNTGNAAINLTVGGDLNLHYSVLEPGSSQVHGSGVVGNDLNVQVEGSILGGVFVGRNVSLTAKKQIVTTVFARKNLNLATPEQITGKYIGFGKITAPSSAGPDVQFLGPSVEVGGLSLGTTFSQGTAAQATSTSVAGVSQNEVKKAVSTDTDLEKEDEKKKQGGGNGPALARRVGRVTVILPKS